MPPVVHHHFGSIVIEEHPAPMIEEANDAIVRVTMSGVSEADLVPGSVVPGREIVGVVEAVGPALTRIKPGQRVVSPPWVFCGGCFYCKQGLQSACEQLQVFGRDLDGSHAEYVRVPNADAVLDLLPDAVGDDQAVLLAVLLPRAFAGLEAAEVKVGTSVVLLGAGSLALATVLLARTMGAGKVLLVSDDEFGRTKATELGAVAVALEQVASCVRELTDSRGADVVVEATGTVAALARGVDLVRGWGTLVALAPETGEEAPFPVARLTAKQARLLSYGGPPVKNHIGTLAKMIARGVLDPRPLISHTFELHDAAHAYALVGNPAGGALRVLLRPRHDP